MARDRLLAHPLAKPLTWIICLLPLAWLVYGAAADRLGANPAEALVRSTGDWALRLLCVALAVTPLRELASWPTLARYRRLLGLFAFFYVSLHLLAYAWFDMGFEWTDVAADIAKRPFILVGFLAFVLLTLLAATSWQRAVRWLGGRRWQQLHRLVFAAGALAVLHFFWMRASKNNLSEVAIYAGILVLLLGWRLRGRWRRLAARAA
jgi:sulfoxide reductase heme-binding subunit YedZ